MSTRYTVFPVQAMHKQWLSAVRLPMCLTNKESSVPEPWSHEHDLEIFGKDITKLCIHVLRRIETPILLQGACDM